MNNTPDSTTLLTTVDPYFVFYLPVPLPPPVTAICVTMCFIGFCVGAVGNTLVILAIIKNRKLRTTANAFLASLAVADLGTCVLVLPIIATAFLSLDVVTTNQLLCRLFYHTTFTLSPVSTQHLILIAVNRYTRINKTPQTYTRLFNRCSISVIITCVWTANIILNVSMAIFSYGTRQIFENEYCKLEQNNVLGIVFTILTMLYTFLSCFVIIPILYVLIFWTVRKSHLRVTPSRPTHGNASTVATVSNISTDGTAEPNRVMPRGNQAAATKLQSHRRLSPSEVKLTKVNFIIFLTNVVFLSPMFWGLALSSPRGGLTHGVFVVVLFPIGINSSINPMVYCGFNRNFRLAFKSLLKIR